MVLFTPDCHSETGFSVSIGDHSLTFIRALTISLSCSQDRALPLPLRVLYKNSIASRVLPRGIVDEPSSYWVSLNMKLGCYQKPIAPSLRLSNAPYDIPQLVSAFAPTKLAWGL